MTLEHVLREWGDFRRALGARDREAFDSMTDRARKHTSAATHHPTPDPLEPLLMAILLEHEKLIRRLEAKSSCAGCETMKEDEED